MTATNLFLITPRALDFGYVPVGSEAAEQVITVTNTSGVSQVMSGTGGGAGVFGAQQVVKVMNLANQPVVMSGTGGGAGVFGGAQNCEGTTLNPGQACQMFYAFSAAAVGTVHGSTTGTWNGQAFSLTFVGTGRS